MGNEDINNKKLLQEIESLDDERENTSEEKKQKTNKWPIIIIIIVLICLATLYFGDSYYNYFDEINDDYDEEQMENYMDQEKYNQEHFEEIKENIIIKDSFLNYNKKLITVISNNTNEPVTDLSIEVIFYDGENKPIEIDSAEISIIEKNMNYYVRFEETPESFERYEFLISKEDYWYNKLEFATDKVEYHVYNDELVAKNNGSEEISEINFQVVYYDDSDKVIDAEDVYIYDLKKGKEENYPLDLTLWNDETYEQVDYNRYEINLIGAYIY